MEGQNGYVPGSMLELRIFCRRVGKVRYLRGGVPGLDPALHQFFFLSFRLRRLLPLVILSEVAGLISKFSRWSPKILCGASPRLPPKLSFGWWFYYFLIIFILFFSSLRRVIGGSGINKTTGRHTPSWSFCAWIKIQLRRAFTSPSFSFLTSLSLFPSSSPTRLLLLLRIVVRTTRLQQNLKMDKGNLVQLLQASQIRKSPYSTPLRIPHRPVPPRPQTWSSPSASFRRPRLFCLVLFSPINFAFSIQSITSDFPLNLSY